MSHSAAGLYDNLRRTLKAPGALDAPGAAATLDPHAIPGYEIGPVLGTGGMGEVYRARQVSLGRDVALKIMTRGPRDDPQWVIRFRRESKIHIGLAHPHLVRVYDAGQVGELCYLALELVDGETLQRRLLVETRLPLVRVLEAALALSDALAHLHGRGVIHRDIKPGNVMFDRSGRIKLMDLGIAKRAGDTLVTMDHQIVGTLAYLAPEAAGGEEAGPPGDIHAVGLLAHEMLTGSLPYRGTNLTDWLLRIQGSVPEPLSRKIRDVPPEVDSLVATMLAKDPATRPRASEIRGRVEAILAGGLPPSASRRPRPVEAGPGSSLAVSPVDPDGSAATDGGVGRRPPPPSTAGWSPGPGAWGETPSRTDPHRPGSGTSDPGGATVGRGSAATNPDPGRSPVFRAVAGVLLLFMAVLGLRGLVIGPDHGQAPDPPAPAGNGAATSPLPAPPERLVIVDRDLIVTDRRIRFSGRTLDPVRLDVRLSRSGSQETVFREEAPSCWHRHELSVEPGTSWRLEFLAPGAGLDVYPPVVPVMTPEAVPFGAGCDDLLATVPNPMYLFQLDKAAAARDPCFFTPRGELAIVRALERRVPVVDRFALRVAGAMGHPGVVVELARRLEGDAPGLPAGDRAREAYALTPRIVEALCRIATPPALEAVERFVAGGYRSWERHTGDRFPASGLRIYAQICMAHLARYHPRLAAGLVERIEGPDPRSAAYLWAASGRRTRAEIRARLESPELGVRVNVLRGLTGTAATPDVPEVLGLWSTGRIGTWAELFAGVQLLQLRGAGPARDLWRTLAARAGSLDIHRLEAGAIVFRLRAGRDPDAVAAGIAGWLGGASPLERRMGLRAASEVLWRRRFVDWPPAGPPPPPPPPGEAGSWASPVERFLVEEALRGRPAAGGRAGGDTPGADPDPGWSGEAVLAAALLGVDGWRDRTGGEDRPATPYRRWVERVAWSVFPGDPGGPPVAALPGTTAAGVPDRWIRAALEGMDRELPALMESRRGPREAILLVDPTLPGCATGIPARAGERVEVRALGLATPRDVLGQPHEFDEGAPRGPDVLTFPDDIWLGIRCGRHREIVRPEPGTRSHVVLADGGEIVVEAGLSVHVPPGEEWLFEGFRLLHHAGLLLVRIHVHGGP